MIEQHTPSRRLFLAAGPAAVVFPALSAAAATEPDPILALIAKAEESERTWFDAEERSGYPYMVPNTPGYEAAWEASAPFRDAHSDDLDRLYKTPPRTTNGMTAYILWMRRYFDGSVPSSEAVYNLFNSPLLNRAAA